MTDDMLALVMRDKGNVPSFCREWLFAPGRRYRFDFAWPERMVAVEVDGGQWKAGGGRHNTDGDRDKMNLAVILGWRVMHFSAQRLEADPDRCVAEIRAALGVT